MARDHEWLVSWVLLRELEDIGQKNTPQYDPNEDEAPNIQSFPQLAKELEPMQQVGDHYIGAEILLTRGDKMARGHIVVQSCDANGKVMCSAHTKPILDIRMYQVEVTQGQFTE